jgi:hypothetical protein
MRSVFFAVAALGLILALVACSPEEGRARANVTNAQADAARAQTAAQAERAAIDNAIARGTIDGAIAGRQIAYVGLGAAAAVLAVGGALVLVTWGQRRAALVYPNDRGLFPVVRMGGRRGAVVLVDPNRSPGVTILTLPADGPAVRQPLAMTEGAALHLTGQAASIQGMVAMTPKKAPPARVAAAPVIDLTPRALSAPMPPITELEPAHVDRLLELTAPDD